MTMTVYKAPQLPPAIRAAIAGMNSMAQIIRYIKTSTWYLAKANAARKNILASLQYAGPSRVINAPVAKSTQVLMRPARVRPGKASGSIILTHREYLGEITGSTTFAAQSFNVNPGLHTTFPWMSGLANSFEQYKILNMSFEFVSIAATSERGRVVLAFDYDVLDDTPNNKVDMFQIAGASEANVWSNTSIKIKPSPKLFTRVGAVASSDLKTYDAGKIIAGVSNAGSTAVVGELFVSYSIELFTPQPSKCAGGQATVAPGTAVVAASPWNGSVVTGSLPFTTGANGPIFTNPGRYLIGYTFDSSVGDPGPGVIIAGTGTTILYNTSANDAGNLRLSGVLRVQTTTPFGRVDIGPTNNHTGLVTTMQVGYSNSF